MSAPSKQESDRALAMWRARTSKAQREILEILRVIAERVEVV